MRSGDCCRALEPDAAAHRSDDVCRFRACGFAPEGFGAAAHKFSVGDLVIIMAYAQMTPQEAMEFKPKVVFPDSNTNKIIE